MSKVLTNDDERQAKSVTDTVIGVRETTAFLSYRYLPV
jgi:hypothetical protein